jgi:RNA polymerase sigma factor (TIGR02999 family)
VGLEHLTLYIWSDPQSEVLMGEPVREADAGETGARDPAWRDPSLVDDVFAGLYTDLREIARRQRHRWHQDYTLNTTALLHEAYLKLADHTGHPTRSRAHFLALAARSMRHILCNYARDRRAQKRGGGARLVALNDDIAQGGAGASCDDGVDALVALDTALRRLAEVDPRRSRVVECRFFGGLTIEETAEALGVSARTIKRDWAVAQAWLHREMTADA